MGLRPLRRARVQGAVVGWLRGNGNVWRDNTWDDGTTTAEPTTSAYD